MCLAVGALSGCEDGEEADRLQAVNLESWALAEAVDGPDGRPTEAGRDSLRRAAQIMAVALGDWTPGPEGTIRAPGRADSIRAKLSMRRGYVLRRLGDRRGAIAAYWMAFAGPLNDSLHVASLRDAAYTTVDSTLGDLITEGDTLRGIAMLDAAEDIARRLGENDLAAVINDCRAALFRGTDAEVPARPSPGAPPLWWAVPALLALVFGLSLWGVREHRRRRRVEAGAESFRAVVARALRE